MVDISEDHTAAELPVDMDLQTLVELSNNMATEEKGMEAELKSLKAAYQQAIGLGRRVTNGGKGNKRGNRDTSTNSEKLSNEINSGVAKHNPEGPRQVKGSDGSLILRMDQLTLRDLTGHTVHLAPEEHVRVTRRQAAERRERQEGQYQLDSWSQDMLAVFLDQEEHLPLRGSTDDTSVWSASSFAPGSYSYTGPAFQRYRSMASQASLTSTSDEGSIVHHNSYLRPDWTNKNPSNLAERALDKFLTLNSITNTKHNSMAKANGILEPHCGRAPNSSSKRSAGHIEDVQRKTTSRESPNKSQVITLEDVEREYGDGKVDDIAEDSDDDSFVELITSRSPAKPISRIEDSVEALDQLEEAIDTLNQATLTQTFVSAQTRTSPDRTASPRTTMIENPVKKGNFSTMRAKPTAPRESILRRVSSMTLKPSPTQESSKNLPPAEPVKRPLSLQTSKATVKSSKPPTIANFELPGEAVAKRLREQREARRIQRELAENNVKSSPTGTIRRTKSTKELTKPAFELPGEALSRKKREAHEARLKAQEEEERKRREFKAKPLRASLQPSVIPRETVASLARKSKMGLEGLDNCNLSINKRGSAIGSNRPSIANVIQANTPAPRSPGTLRHKQSTIITPTMAGLTTQRTVSATDAQAQRQRAREIYNRDQRDTEDLEREKRDREAAARLARDAAAERGRQASREWAERQRVKLANAPDVGFGVGYGPGGQLGLRPF
ncbi:hypothetical protein PVAG01_02588 [Phlyctema vagabunda]|uniref:Carboxylesterase family protein n=1 Tax=Phlyctema vagabunda TaxID=108571 RepID=A0ABR4PRL9_9HELO